MFSQFIHQYYQNISLSLCYIFKPLTWEIFIYFSSFCTIISSFFHFHPKLSSSSLSSSIFQSFFIFISSDSLFLQFICSLYVLYISCYLGYLCTLLWNILFFIVCRLRIFSANKTELQKLCLVSSIKSLFIILLCIFNNIIR